MRPLSITIFGYLAIARQNRILPSLPPDMFKSAAGQLALAHYPAGGSPHQDQMADQFLCNRSLTNRLDPRFAPAQRYVDAVAGESHERAGQQAAEIEAIVEHRRQNAANHIRAGDMLMRGYGKVAIDTHKRLNSVRAAEAG